MSIKTLIYPTSIKVSSLIVTSFFNEINMSDYENTRQGILRLKKHSGIKWDIYTKLKTTYVTYPKKIGTNRFSM